jgi:uncharacterized membrane protein
MGEKLKSRKFWLALLGALLPIVAQALTGEVGWQEATMASITLLASYILGQGYVDGKAVEGTVPEGRELANPE